MEAQLPQFDPSTLLNLTKTIEGNLKKPVGKSPKLPRPPRAKQEQRPITTDQQSKKTSSVAVKVSSGSTKQDGGKKKRLDGGKNKGSVGIKSTIKLGNRPDNFAPVRKSRLEEEVLALGGEKDDLELIADVGSESEMEEMAAPASNRLQRGLEKDLHRFVMDLGISSLEKRELSSSSEVEEPEHRGIEQYPTALRAQGISSMEAAVEKQPRNLSAKGSSKLVISLRSHLSTNVLCQLADGIFAAIGTPSSMAFGHPTFCLISGTGRYNSPSTFRRYPSSACEVTSRE